MGGNVGCSSSEFYAPQWGVIFSNSHNVQRVLTEFVCSRRQPISERKKNGILQDLQTKRARQIFPCINAVIVVFHAIRELFWLRNRLSDFKKRGG
jgi:hypothetical protein